MPNFEHPLKLYTLEHPENWEARCMEESGVVILYRGETEDPGALSILPLAVTGPPESLPTLVLDYARNTGTPITEAEVVMLSEGESAIAYGEGPAGEKFPGSVLRFWAMRNGPVRLTMAHIGPGASVQSQREEVDAIVTSFRFPEIQPPTPAEFQARVLEVLEREHGHLEAQATGEWTLRVSSKTSGEKWSMGLNNLYRRALLEPESAGALIREHLDKMVPSIAWLNVDSFEAVRRRLMPVLKPRGWEQSDATGPTSVYVEFAPGLLCCFVIDDPKAIAFVRPEVLERWGVPLELVQGAALDNLTARSQELRAAAVGLDPTTGNATAIVIGALDGFDAARFVLPDVREMLAEKLGDEYLVGVPNRDFFIAFSPRDPKQARIVARQVRRDFEREQYPITGNIYRVHGDRIELWDPDEKADEGEGQVDQDREGQG